MTKRKCHECNLIKSDVLSCGPRWDVGGDHIGHLEWSKDDIALFLCEECEQSLCEDYRHCDKCGALVSVHAPLLEDLRGNPVCPDCDVHS